MADSNKISSGVQSLITRLKDEGVQAGESEAERIVQEAQKRAAEILEKARTESDEILTRAHDEARAERTAAQDALKLAARDTVLDLRAQLTSNFETTIKRLVSTELRDQEFLKRLILAIASRSVPDEVDGTLELLLSDELFPSEENGDESLRHFIQELIGEVTKEGIELKPAGRNTPGVRMRMTGEELEVDMTDEAVAGLLIKHLLPRYRVYLEGER